MFPRSALFFHVIIFCMALEGAPDRRSEIDRGINNAIGGALGVPTSEQEQALGVPQDVEYQSRDEGIFLINPDGSEHPVIPGSPEEDEIAYQMVGGAPRGTITYRLKMLSNVDGQPTNPTASRAEQTPPTPHEPAPATTTEPVSAPEEEPISLHEVLGESVAKSLGVEQPTTGPSSTSAPDVTLPKGVAESVVFDSTTWTGDPDVSGRPPKERHEAPPVDRPARREAPSVRPETRESLRTPRAWDPVDPYLIFGDRPDAVERKGRDWRVVDPRRYVGIEIKSTREILTNKRDAQLFGEILKAINPEASESVLARYGAGDPTPEDMNFITFATKEYSLSLKLAEEASNMVTSQDVELLARRDKNLDNLLTHEGKHATEMVKSAIFHMAMKDPDAVKDMSDAFKSLKKDRESFRFGRVESKIEALCERAGIDRKDYGAVFNMNSKEGRKATKADLERRFHERAGKFRRALDWANKFRGESVPTLGSSRHAAIRAMFKTRTIPNSNTILSPTAGLLKRVDKNLADIAEALGSTIGDKETRDLIVRETLSNQNLSLLSEGGPKTFEEVQNLNKKQFSEKSIETRIKERVTADRDWKSRTLSEQNDRLREWKNEERGEHAGGGFWAWLFNIIFGRNFDRAASKVTGRTVHI